LKLHGKIIRDTKLIKEALVEKDEGLSFRDALEESLVDLCRQLEIQVPIWLKRNTSEFGIYRKTFFTQEQFIEKINFDRFEIRLL